MDVVYICRPGDDNEELRYSLRSLKNIPHKRVFIFGDAPVWVRNCEVIRVPPRKQKHDTGIANIAAACNHPDVSDPFLLMNDDFYIMAPMDRVPHMNMGPLERVIREHRKGSAYRNAMQATYDRLLTLVDGPIGLVSYEVHMPMEIDKVEMLLALSLGKGIYGVQWRSLYGNLSGLVSTEVKDVKIYRGDTRREYDQWPLLSTSDRTFKYHPAGRYVRESFPDVGPYEFHREKPQSRRAAVRYRSLVATPK